MVLIWLHASLVFLTRYLGLGVLQCKGGDGNVVGGEHQGNIYLIA